LPLDSYIIVVSTPENLESIRMRDHPRSPLALIGSFKLALLLATTLLGSSFTALALDPSLEISQYAHTSWTARDGYSLGAVFAMAQTPDGYLWLGAQFGLFRFDGVRFIPWQPPVGQQLPDKPYSLLVTRDGTLWIGTFSGLVSWNGAELTRYPEIGQRFVTSLLEDREGTVWAGVLGGAPSGPTGRLCAIRSGGANCYGEDGTFGSFVWSLGEDGSGALWAGAESGVWRWKPGTPKRYEIAGMRPGDLSKTEDAGVLIGISGAGLRQIAGDKVEPYPIHSPTKPNALLPDHDVGSNKLLRDRDGGLWIGTSERGLIHVHNGRTDVLTKSDGLSGDIACSLFEDREGNVWFASTVGLDRFREIPVNTITAKQGLSSDIANSVVAATDGSIWVATHDGLNRWKDGRITVFRKTSGLPSDVTQSLYQDHRERIWVFTDHGLAYFNDGRFVAVGGVASNEVYSITGDKAGNLWLSGNKGLSHLLEGRLVEHFPWSALGRRQQAKVILADQGGLWLSFWTDGGVLYFKDGQVRASYTPAEGLGKGHVPGLLLDGGAALWAATEEGGLSRIKDGRVTTLTSRNGLPCDTIHWTMEDDDRSLWLYTACGLVRVARAELDAWLADPKRRVETTAWDMADGVKLNPVSPSSWGPTFAKAADGKFWSLIGAEGIAVVDPRHLVVNKLPPPVYIEQVTADRQTYDVSQGLRLPSSVRDLAIQYTALSFVAPEKVKFRYKLEGYDNDWHDSGNRRQAIYTNLPPRSYRFRVMAANNSGVWNEEGALLVFSIAPAFYQTIWFRLVAVAVLLGLLWLAYQLRVRQLAHEFNKTLEARVSERTRIARDLHDTLLQSFQGLLLRFQSASKILPERPVEAKQRLDSALDQAAAAIAEGRDAVQGLRSAAFETNDLANAITAIGAELTSDLSVLDSPIIDVEVHGPARNLNPVVRDEAYRITGEALRNAYRHAQARRIIVEIRYDKRLFRLTVRDNGMGIDDEAIRQEPAGHFGLHGMRERAEIVGGRLEVWSKRDKGTEVELSIPGKIAYGTPVQRSWFSKLLSGKRSINESTEP
jgi:signal transduction histidine kinase/ligand-binding sensor domain-containing protein